jgi:hypothetical protein
MEMHANPVNATIVHTQEICIACRLNIAHKMCVPVQHAHFIYYTIYVPYARKGTSGTIAQAQPSTRVARMSRSMGVSSAASASERAMSSATSTSD